MRGKAVRFDRFVEGVNTQSAPYDLSEREARDARNVVATVRGAIRKRDGSVSFATPPAALRGVFAGTTPDVLIGSSASALYGITTGGVVTTLKTGLANALWSWVQAPSVGGQGPFYGMNATGTPQQWDGVAGSTSDWTASAGAVPNGKSMVYAGNRVWVATDDAVYWSEIGDPRNWPAANVVRFDPADGETLTGLGTAGPYVLVFKASKIWRIYDLDTGANQPVSQSAGCVAGRSITPTPAGTFFLSADQGVMVTDGQSARPVGEKIGPTIDAIAPGNRGLAAGAFFDGHLYLAVSQSGTGNDLLLDYDVLQQSWWLHSLPVAQPVVWDTGGEPRLYGARADVARVDRLMVPGVTQDAGTDFAGYWTGSFHTFGAPYLRKRCREIHFDGKGRIQVSLTKDFMRTGQQVSDESFIEDTDTFGGSGTFGDTGTFGGLVDIGEASIPTPGVARAFSVTFGNSADESFEVESYTFAIQMRKD